MRNLRGLYLTILLGCLWCLSGVIANNRMQGLVEKGDIPYGPLPAIDSASYSYEGLRRPFDPTLPLKRANELTKEEFESLILTSLNPKMQEGLRPYLGSVLNFSVEYQMDPFWIISIIMVESNFNLTAVSPKNARGLMQIKPDTAIHLYQLMQKNLTEAEVSKNLYHPEENIEVGVFYLKKLLQNFRMNYRFATVAYNIGPGKLRNRLIEKSLDVDNFSYLVKVKDNYLQLAQKFSVAIKGRPHPYEGTYVYSEQGLKMEEKVVDLFANTLSKTTSENLTAFSF